MPMHMPMPTAVPPSQAMPPAARPCARHCPMSADTRPEPTSQFGMRRARTSLAAAIAMSTIRLRLARVVAVVISGSSLGG